MSPLTERAVGIDPSPPKVEAVLIGDAAGIDAGADAVAVVVVVDDDESEVGATAIDMVGSVG
jgi:hypothetical protein